MRSFSKLDRRPRHATLVCVLTITGALAVVRSAPPQQGRLFRAPAVSNVIDGVVFEAGNWTPDLKAGNKGRSLGNHRAVVELDGSPAAGADS